MGLIAAVILAHGSIIKALAMVVFGLLLGMIGTDVNSGVARFSFDIPELTDGLNFTAVAMGIFGFGEIIANLEQRENREVFTKKVGKLLPTMAEFKASLLPIVRGTALGSFLGLLPGGGAVLSSFTSYAVEKKMSKTPERFGKGAIEGVAGPEAANNAGAQASFIPMLTLGIPTNAVMALMVAGMMIHNIQPGPQVMTSNPTLFWGLIASMWLGNAMLMILNLPLIGIWIKLLTVPYRILYPAILLFCCVGVYSVNNNVFDVFITIPFAILGYVFRKFECEPAPLLLGLVLGQLMEEYLRRAMTISRGEWSIFVTRPLSLTLLIIAALLLVIVFLPAVAKKREEAFAEED
jgi:TctA family transporter